MPSKIDPELPVRMASFRRTLPYVVAGLIWFTVLAGLGLSFDFWRSIDYQIYRSFYLSSIERVQLNKNLRVIDIPYSKTLISDADPTEYRSDIAAFLKTVAASADIPPRAIFLDAYFKLDRRGRAELLEALEAVKSKGIGVFATTDPRKLWSEHDEEIYNALTGYGHTSLDPYPGFLTYKCSVKLLGDSKVIDAIPVVLVNSLDFKTKSCERPDGSMVLIAGEKALMDGQTYGFEPDRHAKGAGKLVSMHEPKTEISFNELRHAIVVVGSFIADKHSSYSDQEGPKLVAWAINDLLSPGGTGRQPINSLAMLAILPLGFALFTVCCTAFFYKYAPKLQTRPIVLGCLSVAATLGVMTLVECAFISLGRVLPLGYSIFVAVSAAVLAGRFQYVFLTSGEVESLASYDVFVSYARSNKDWVKKKICEPLEVAGKKVFFDESSIGLGTPFVARYMWGIVESRVFVPVFTDGYYRRDHCRNEADLALHRSVSKKIRIIPVTFPNEETPEIFGGLNSLDGTKPDFEQRLIEEIA